MSLGKVEKDGDTRKGEDENTPLINDVKHKARTPVERILYDIDQVYYLYAWLFPISHLIHKQIE